MNSSPGKRVLTSVALIFGYWGITSAVYAELPMRDFIVGFWEEDSAATKAHYCAHPPPGARNRAYVFKLSCESEMGWEGDYVLEITPETYGGSTYEIAREYPDCIELFIAQRYRISIVRTDAIYTTQASCLNQKQNDRRQYLKLR